MIQLSTFDTALALAPLFVAAGIYIAFTMRPKEITLASTRMVLQLIAIGYFLTYLFDHSSSVIGYIFLGVMLLAASYISLRHVSANKKLQFLAIGLSLGITTIIVMAWVGLLVLKLNPFYQPSLLIPLSGMVLATAMNALSVCIERLQSEKQKIETHVNNTIDKLNSTNQGEKYAFNAALIPLVNSFFAVGLVSLPGMMTGQILAGVSPLVAVRYQIMIMSILFFSAVVSVALYLWLQKKLTKQTS